MRVWGRIPNPDAPPQFLWVAVTTDANGYNDACFVTALIQCLLLNWQESPFWANYGIPAQQSVAQQVPPDLFITRIQQFFAPNFASLIVAKTAAFPPTYQINIITHQGSVIAHNIPIPE